jgi:hypothetical protein
MQRQTYAWLAAAAMVMVGWLTMPAPARAQEIELSPYFGGFFPTETLGGEDFKDEGLFGVRVGGFVTERVTLEANLGYANEFTYSGSNGQSRAWIWDGNALFHFVPADINLSPFLSVGVGGLTASLKDADSIFFLYSDDGGFPEVGDPEPGLRVVRLDDGDTFFEFN